MRARLLFLSVACLGHAGTLAAPGGPAAPDYVCAQNGKDTTVTGLQLPGGPDATQPRCQVGNVVAFGGDAQGQHIQCVSLDGNSSSPACQRAMQAWANVFAPCAPLPPNMPTQEIKRTGPGYSLTVSADGRDFALAAGAIKLKQDLDGSGGQGGSGCEFVLNGKQMSQAGPCPCDAVQRAYAAVLSASQAAAANCTAGPQPIGQGQVGSAAPGQGSVGKPPRYPTTAIHPAPVDNGTHSVVGNWQGAVNSGPRPQPNSAVARLRLAGLRSIEVTLILALIVSQFL